MRVGADMRVTADMRGIVLTLVDVASMKANKQSRESMKCREVI